MNAGAIRLLKKARTEAELMNDGHVGVEHVFLATVSVEGEFVKWLEQRWGVFPLRLRDLLKAAIGKGVGTDHFMPYSMRLKQILDRATELAGAPEEVSVELIFFAILTEGKSIPVKILKEEFRLDIGEVAKSWAAERCNAGRGFR
jgi:ATP-dependent Clp protease ATP-binding subunit ClpA